MSRLKDIPEQSHSEYFLGEKEQVSLKKYMPKPKPAEVLKGVKGAPKLSEDEVIAICRKWLKAQGWSYKTIFTGGIPLGGGRYAPNPAEGIPDTICYHILWQKGCWIEFKKSHGGRVSVAQVEWRQILTMMGNKVFTISSLEQLQEEMGEWLK